MGSAFSSLSLRRLFTFNLINLTLLAGLLGPTLAAPIVHTQNPDETPTL
jgi:hypothetical protein